MRHLSVARGGSVRHALVDHPLPGIDASRRRKLEKAGVDCLEAVVEIGHERLAELTGFDEKTSLALLRVAQSALARTLPGVIEFVPPNSEPPTARLARGLEAARELERWLGLVRAVRSHVGKQPAKAKWAEEHHEARRQLKKLRRVLEELQQDVLADGLSSRGFRHLKAQLAPVQDLRALTERPVKRRVYTKLAARARSARKGLRQQRPR
jgi:hypothetical protein